MPETLLTRLRKGGKKALAEAFAQIEAAPTAPSTIGLLDEAYHGAKGHVIGITGPPGVGKSTLIAALISAFRACDETIGVIAVDPSSHRSGGALLGDRVRLDTDPADTGVFVRSMAARDRLGGLASMTSAAAVLMRAVFDRVIVETVGVGQSETDIATVADTVVLCIQPGSGDSLQFMKAGIAEIPDIALVTKADLGDVAIQTKRDLRSALATVGGSARHTVENAWKIPVLSNTHGMEDDTCSLIEALDCHYQHLKAGMLSSRRQSQADAWLTNVLREAYGREGLKIAKQLPGGMSTADTSPYRRLEELQNELSTRLSRPGET